MILAFDSSVSAQQKRWVQDAFVFCGYNGDALSATITVVAGVEPPCPGHRDYMCTQEITPGSAYRLTMRSNADQGSTGAVITPDSLTGDSLKRFFMESMVHELGHVVTFSMLSRAADENATKASMANRFYRSAATGVGGSRGTLAQWDDLTDAWEDRIQEAVAEVFKDAFMPEAHRYYENRSNWGITEADYFAMMTVLLENT